MDVKYTATKTASKFHHDDNFVRLLIGAVGSGKSVADCAEVFRRACEQEPGYNGIRCSRWGIIRNTYPELKSTTIKTWQEWFPESRFGAIRWDSPITHRICLGGIDLEVIFLALDSPEDVKKLMSFEFTGIYINELQFVHPKIFKTCMQRVNRYPPKKSGASITWTGVIADTNPPSTRHWIYKQFEKDRPSNFSVHKYDPALLILSEIPKDETPYAVSSDKTIYCNNPEADYLDNLPDRNYYLNQVPSSTDEEIKVYMLGEYGVVIDGRPIHPEYKDRLHYAAKELVADPEIEIGLGWDFGLTPACAINQRNSKGQLIVLDELYSDDMALEEFAEFIVIPLLNSRYPFWRTSVPGQEGKWIKKYISRHDPAGQGRKDTDEKTCQQILSKLGVESLPAANSNAAMPRRNALKYFLKRLTCGEPAFLLSSRAPMIREGLMGHYQYAAIKANEGMEARYHETPLKNMHSHICEAQEYIAMYYENPSNEEKGINNVAVKSIAHNFLKTQQLKRSAYG